MFKGFAHVWTPVQLAARLEDKPLPLTIAGTTLVLFRDGEGRPTALLDRCAHRGAALSLGRVKDGCIECPFHGWRFGADGGVRHVPWNPDAKTLRAHVVSFPVREAGRLIWIYTAPVVDAPYEPSVPEVLLRDDVRVTAMDVTFATHWTRAMENMLDWPHLPFVHKRTIGKGMVDRASSRMDIRMEDRSWGFHSTIAIDGEEQPGSLQFRWPNSMVLTIPVPGKTLVMQNVCVPTDANTTRMFVVTMRDFAKMRVLDSLFNRSNRPILEEDRAVVESSWPAEVPLPKEESSVRTDAPTLYFRKRYFDELYGSSIEPARGAADVRRTLSVDAS